MEYTTFKTVAEARAAAALLNVVLDQYADNKTMAPVWRIKILRAYGHAYAAQGKEKESLEKFREALLIESQK